MKSTGAVAKQKQNEKKKYSIATVSLQVLGSGAEGAPASLFVFTDPCRYLFNCGEGSQRMAFEHKVRISKIEHIFVTSKSWRNVGGLLGMILTLQDTGIAEVNIHGPVGMKSIFEECRQFAQVQNIRVNFLEHEEEREIIKENETRLSIQTVPINATVNNDLVDSEEEDGNVADELTVGEKRHPLFNSPEEIPKKRLCRGMSNDLALAYICKTPSLPGRLLINKCKELNVPSGPLLGQLKRGIDITLPSGKIVKAADVTESSDPGKLFIVIEVPSMNHLTTLLNTEVFQPFQVNGNKISEVVVHFTPFDITQSDDYKKWMSKFPLSTTHIMINEDNKCLGIETAHKLQYKLNLLNARIFPLLRDDSMKVVQESTKEKVSTNGVNNNDLMDEEESSSDDSVGNCRVIPAVTALLYQIRPSSKLDLSKVPVLYPDKYIKECFDEDGFKESLETAKLKFMDSFKLVQDFPNILFLGTGSCIPNKSRNTSGILVNCSEDKCMLLDCGEGTYGQLVRCHGLDKSEEVLRKLCVIYVSHRHADHHAGLIGILHARRKAFKKFGLNKVPKVPILIPSRILNFLDSFEENFESIYQDYYYILNSEFLTSKIDNAEMNEVQKNVLTSLEMSKIETCYVHHCKGSFGVSFTHRDGWKITYSGDTMPCEALIQIGKDCDILIHEATMEDGMEKEAKLKTHSTVSQAIDVGNAMNAKHIVLTHFSQRYARLPMLGMHTDSQVGIAFDNMRVYLEDIKRLCHLYPALKIMFAEDYERTKTKLDKKVRNEALAAQLVDEDNL